MNFGSIPFVARATPAAAAPSSIEWVSGGTPYSATPALSHSVSIGAGGEVGDMLLLAVFPFGTVDSVVTNTGQTLTLRTEYASAGEIGRIYSVQIEDTVPTSVTIDLTEANNMKAQALVARGVTQTAGVVNDGSTITERTNLTYTTDVTDALVVTVYAAAPNDRVLSTASYPGPNTGTIYGKFPFDSRGVVVGLHDGATGANNIAVTWSAADSGGRWLSLALKP